MAKAKIYPGLTGWCNFKPGNHDWTADHSRPFLNLTKTNAKGKRSYQGLFLNEAYADGTKNPHLTVEETETHVILTIEKAPAVKLFSVNSKDLFS